MSKRILLRAEVRRFAEKMELKLRENDGKGGWEDSHVYWLTQRIGDEHKELIDAIVDHPGDIHAIVSECSDVANFAMMVADIVYRYGVQNVVPISSLANPENQKALLTSTSATIADKDRIAELTEKLNDWSESYRKIINDGGCPDEIHCACVPALRDELSMLNTVIKALLAYRHANTLNFQLEKLDDHLNKLRRIMEGEHE